MGVGQGTGSGEGLALVNAAKSETWGLNLATEGPSSKRSPTPYKESEMPTGYTDKIKDGITFKEYAMGCARAFGALITMRDNPAVLLSGVEWRAAKLESVAHNLRYHTEGHGKEVDRAEERTAWVNTLRGALR